MHPLIPALMLPSMVATMFTQQGHFNTVHDNWPGVPHCPIDAPLACQDITSNEDSCCLEKDSGLMIQALLWEYEIPPSDSGNDIEHLLGPKDVFTNHGLWNDNCDGTYDEFCRLNYTVTDVSRILESPQFNGGNLSISGEGLLKKMRKYWKGGNGHDISLWNHEFNKHALCMSTLDPVCYSRSDGDGDNVQLKHQHQAVYDYFRIAMDLYETLDPYKVLIDSGFSPTNAKTYDRASMEAALRTQFGHDVYIDCDTKHALNGIYYAYLLKGSVLSQKFVPTDAPIRRHTCPEHGVKWVPKGFRSIPGHSDKQSKGRLRIGDEKQYLIRSGELCLNCSGATFTLTKDAGGIYSLQSGAGRCGLQSEDILVCGRGVTPAEFSFSKNDSSLSIYGIDQWHVDNSSSPKNKVSVHLGAPDKENKSMQFRLHFESFN